jgi:hypothetical protein
MDKIVQTHMITKFDMGVTRQTIIRTINITV